METRNLVIICIWAFILLSIVLFYLQGSGMNFEGYLILLVIALIATFLVAYAIPEKK